MASITGKLFRVLMVDRSAKNKSLDVLQGQLSESKQTILNKIGVAADNEANREQLSHVIGIERWGQYRLRVLLGEPLKMDEYEGYRPQGAKSLAELAEEFSQTRQATLALGEQITAIPEVATKTIEHNDMGIMSVRSWFQYLDMHGTYELRNVK